MVSPAAYAAYIFLSYCIQCTLHILIHKPAKTGTAFVYFYAFSSRKITFGKTLGPENQFANKVQIWQN